MNWEPKVGDVVIFKGDGYHYVVIGIDSSPDFPVRIELRGNYVNSLSGWVHKKDISIDLYHTVKNRLK